MFKVTDYAALKDSWYWKPIFGVLFEWPLKTGFTVFSHFRGMYRVLYITPEFAVGAQNILLDLADRVGKWWAGDKNSTRLLVITSEI